MRRALGVVFASCFHAECTGAGDGRYLLETLTTSANVMTAATAAEVKKSVPPPASNTLDFVPATPIGPLRDCGLGDDDVDSTPAVGVAGVGINAVCDGAATIALGDCDVDAEDVIEGEVVCVDDAVIDGDAPTDKEDVGVPDDVGVGDTVALPVAV